MHDDKRQPDQLEAFKALHKGFEETMNFYRRVWQDLREALRDADFGVGGKPIMHQYPKDETPREKSLRLRQTRNTGPAKPSIHYRHQHRGGRQ